MSSVFLCAEVELSRERWAADSIIVFRRTEFCRTALNRTGFRGGLLAKKDRDNIEDDELAAFRSLAKAYAGLTESQVDQLLTGKHLMEICYDDKA
ncbi:MAG: hypothetical protein EOP24_06675 [Hyphomicrobiales bacterium]|nr:MAG: hypothetical protein EOP24_06675 [Hyphomicrobiales bacterium]